MDLEKGVASVKFSGIEAGTSSEGDGSECEATRAMVVSQNRKKKKSGGFQSMGLSHPVFTGVMKKGYRVPTPIQRKCIPLIMNGKDVVAMARTGSGKTAAFLLPMFERLKAHSSKMGARAILLSPTRELATQTFKFTKELGRFTTLKAVLVLGGNSMEEQFSALHQSPDIIVATPGRFLHLLVEMDLVLTSVEYVVFDEADRLFELGFLEQLREILRRLPETRQTLLFSATLPRMLVEFAKAGLQEPVLVRLDVEAKLSEQLRTVFLSVRGEDKAPALLYLLQSVVPSGEQTVVFTATKHHVEYLKELLELAGLSCTHIYSSLDQAARKINVAKFVNKKAMVLLVTDIAARGIDIPMLDNVINYSFPAKPKLFVHRVGRVARAGRSGSAYSLVAPDEVAYMLDLHLFLGSSVQSGQNISPKSSGVYGGVPQSVLDQSSSFISQLHSSSDLDTLKSVADNAQKQYVRSRSQPAPESVKRAKSLPSITPLHPLFTVLCSAHEVEQCQLLQGLRSFKPSQTIFEIHSTTKTSAKQVMRAKRNYHSAAIQSKRQQQWSRVSSGTDFSSSTPSLPQEAEDLLRTFQTEQSARNELQQHRKHKAAVVSEHYVNYTPADHHSERGLTLGGGVSFDQQASNAVLDMDDDEGTARKHKPTVQWDRKRKKFVGESEKEALKKRKIRTESGQWIQASYKSGVYQEWKDKHKIDTAPLVGGEVKGQSSKGKKGGHRRKGGLSRSKLEQRGKGGGGADLKPKAVILRNRQKKEMLERRRKVKNSKKRRQTARK